MTIIAGATRAASGQSTPVTGSDLLPKVVSNKLVTGAHFDPTGEDLENVRVFGWAFQSDSLDPYFIQDPGFNAPAGSGLPSGTAFGFDVLSSLTFWNGSGVPTFGPAPTSESVLYTFGIKSTTITGSSGVQPGFSIGTVAADGSVHKHLNAFLNGPDGNSDPSDGGLPANGVYSFSFRITDTGAGIAASDPLYAVYGNGASTAAIDRAKFRIRNYNAPGTRLAGTVTNLIGLSPLAGEVNLATGGQVTITGGNGGYTSEVEDLTSNANRGSAVLNHVGSEGKTLVMLWLGGSNSDINTLISSLDGQAGYDIASSSAGIVDPLYADIQKLSPAYAGFNALVAFDATPDNGALTWDFSATPTVVLDKVAAVPEPGAFTCIAFAAAAGLVRRKSR